VEGEVSAREVLRTRLVAYMDVSHEKANELIDAFAHELAEKQRAFADQGLEGEVPAFYVAGVKDAADLIDPEKNIDKLAMEMRADSIDPQTGRAT
jgi:hypothetical protein